MELRSADCQTRPGMSSASAIGEASYASSTCSSVNQSAYQFSKIFQGFYVGS